MKKSNKALINRAVRLALDGQIDQLSAADRAKLEVILKWQAAGIAEDWDAIREGSKDVKVKDEAALVGVK